MKLKAYQNRFGVFGLVPEDSTITGDMAEVASARTREWSEVIVQAVNQHDALMAVAEAVRAMKHDINIFYAKYREQDNRYKIALDKALAALDPIKINH